MLKIAPKVVCRLQISRCLSAVAAEARPSGQHEQSWQIIAAVCLEQQPVISRAPSKLLADYKQFISRVEFEQSLMCSHEVRKAEDKFREEKIARGEVEETAADKQVQTAQDFEDMAKEEFSRFTALAEKAGGKDYERYPERKLVLVVKQSYGSQADDEKRWTLPFSFHKDQESLRQTAERALENLDCKMDATIIGNAPIGFHKCKYSKTFACSTNHFGAKIFFYKAYLKNNIQGIHMKELPLEYKWLAHSELYNYLDKSYYKSIRKFLVE